MFLFLSFKKKKKKKMARRTTSKGNIGSAPASMPHAAKAPAMKYQEASRLADKNSRTIMKLEQLVVSFSYARIYSFIYYFFI